MSNVSGKMHECVFTGGKCLDLMVLAEMVVCFEGGNVVLPGTRCNGLTQERFQGVS